MKTPQKSAILVAFALLIAGVMATSSCLYCRRQDKNAGFLVGYSYCNQTDSCLKDAWNYINRDCVSGWKRGKSYSIDFCNPEEISCPTYQSLPEKYGTYENQTWSLAAGGQCVVELDATAGVARVIFDEVSYLGIQGAGGKGIGEVITVKSGIKKITLYNGAESGPLTFLISFSGAVTTAVTLATTVLVSSMMI